MTAPNLPRIFPIVLYNGLRPWNAPLSFHQTQKNEPHELSPWQPQSQYFLIDQLHLPNYQLPNPDNLAGLLIRIERSVNLRCNLFLDHMSRLIKRVNSLELRGGDVA